MHAVAFPMNLASVAFTICLASVACVNGAGISSAGGWSTLKQHACGHAGVAPLYTKDVTNATDPDGQCQQYCEDADGCQQWMVLVHDKRACWGYTTKAIPTVNSKFDCGCRDECPTNPPAPGLPTPAPGPTPPKPSPTPAAPTLAPTPIPLPPIPAHRTAGPCDIFAAAHTPCVAAHSMVRALYAAYDGPLYAIARASDNATMVIRTDPVTGFAAAGAQAAFCPTSTRCSVERIFDQTARGNHLDKIYTPSTPRKIIPTTGPDPMKERLEVAGHGLVYSAYFEGNPDLKGNGTIGFRAETTSGVAIGDEPESMYAVVSGTHYSGGCCFDYGNSEGNHGKPIPVPPAHSSDGKMEAISFGTSKPAGGTWSKGTGDGPWVRADLEMGVWAANERGTINHPAVNPRSLSLNSTFVTAMLKGRSGGWTLKGGDSQVGRLATLFDGPRPDGYEIMYKQGAIVLGIGGDGSDGSAGTFYEGAMTANYTSDATDEAVQANIVATYGGAAVVAH